MARALVVAVVLAWPAAALAGDGDHALSLALGYGTYSIVQLNATKAAERRTMHGGALVLDYDRGFGDAWGFKIMAAGGLGDGPTGLAWNASGTVGLRYALDVLRYVPYVHAGVGAMIVGGGGIDREVKPIVELGAGIDVLESTTWSWGVSVRVETLGTDVVFFTITPRLSYHWGYF
jgi:hypothetical protein